MAIKEQDKVFYEEASNGDKIINLPISRVNNIEGIGRSISTVYSVGDVVYVDNNKKVALKCTQAGATSSSELDISTKAVGDTVTDGGVVWSVVGRISDSVPIGTIFAFGANEHPIGYLACDGTAVSRIVYADLFAVIGTTYGAGDGSTTFNLPNLNNNSFLEGSDTAGTVKSAGLPNITGGNGWIAAGKDNAWIGAFQGTYASGGTNQATGSTSFWNMTFDASRCSSVYGNSTTVQPKSVTVKFCIKAYGAITNAGSVELEEMVKDYERIASSYLPLSGGNITGELTINGLEVEALTTKEARYIRYENGLQICFFSVPTNVMAGNVSFPVPFSICPVAVPIVRADTSKVYMAQINGISTTSVSFFQQNVEGYPAESGLSFDFIVIGYWK